MLCVCVSAPDQTLIAIFSPTEVGGCHPAPCGEDRVWILGGEGKSKERQAVKDDGCRGRVCTVPQPPVRECRRSILDNCFVYRITNNWFDYFFPSKLTEPTGCFGAKQSLPFITYMWPCIYLCLVFSRREFPSLENGDVIPGGLEVVKNACGHVV